MDLEALSERQRESARAAKEIGDAFAFHRLDRQSGENTFAFGGRLEKTAWRRRHARRAHQDFRRAALDEDFAMAGEPGKIEPPSGGDKRLPQHEIQSTRAAKINIEAGKGGRDGDIERLAEPMQSSGDFSRACEGGAHRWREDWTGFDSDDAMGARLHIADACSFACVAGVKSRAPSPLAMSVDERMHICFEDRKSHV